MQQEKDQHNHLQNIRHSLAHVLAQAVLAYRPGTQLGFGPATETGFYYEFDIRGEALEEKDLKDIEKLMRKIVSQGQAFEKFELSIDQMRSDDRVKDQLMKVEYAAELIEKKSIAGQLSFYQNGPFVDMCEGPHVANTKDIHPKSFTLSRMGGSYWRADEKNAMLTRIYGLAFESPEALKEYQEMQRLAEQRDHKKLGSELDLFTVDEEIGLGLPLWLPNGTIIRDELEKWAKEEEFRAGYKRVSTPVLTRKELFFHSGHLPYYKDSMFPPLKADDDEEYYLRPMNCPFHHKVYASSQRSYRDLPLRIAEYCNTFRYEKHGSLSGLLRVRAMCMNDAHIYCAEEDVEKEFAGVIKLYRGYFEKLRMGPIRARLSMHDSDKGKFVENEDGWNNAEEVVRQVLKNNEIDFEEERGEAAFYGPKMDVQIKNVYGREETISTCQLDFVVAERFDLEYKASDGSMKRPMIIHRSPLSTHERMISFLIEAYGGAFPSWLAPVQVRILSLNEEVNEYASELGTAMTNNLLRVEVDTGQDSVNKKIRNAVTRKIPNIWVVGGRERDERKITWRRYCVQEQLTVDADTAMAAVSAMVSGRMMDNFADVALPL